MTKYRKLNKKSNQRIALIRNQVTNLLYYNKITTTESRAKEIRKVVEKLISIAIKARNDYRENIICNKIEKKIKIDNPFRLNIRRKILSFIYSIKVNKINNNVINKKKFKKINIVNKIFDEIALKYINKNGGYTRIIKIGYRNGDAAKKVILELI